jgi:DNA-binding GntR family transcriptional regulator
VLYHILGELEGLAGFYAAKMPRSGRMRLVKEIREINGQMAAQSRDGTPDIYQAFRLDALFHRRCVESSAPPRLLVLHEAIKPQADRYARLYSAALIGKLDLSVPISEHDRIVRAIEAGDADGAQEAVRNNWRNAAGRITAAIEEWGESGGW